MNTHSMQSKQSIQLITLLSLIIALSSCDTTFVDPFSNTDRFFTIYGYLDEAKNIPGRGAHAVRIIPITRRSAIISSPADPNANIDARVFVINTSTGQEVEWRHGLQRLSDTEYGHIFRSTMPVAGNTTYRIEVRRSDGIVTSAETTLPAVSTTNIVQDPDPIVDPITGDIIQGILIPGVHIVWEMDVIYYIGGGGCFTSTPVRVPYGRTGTYDGEGWRFEAQVSSDLRNANEEELLDGGVLCAIGIETQVPDDKWILPETQAGVDSLAFTNIPSNVENGLGFFGSLGIINNAWNTSDTLKVLFALQ